jgi:hypothetical protein
MLNWKEIKRDYNRSYSRFIENMFPYVGVLCPSTLQSYDIKKLYYFFDDQYVFLTIERICVNHWVYTITLGDGKVYSSGRGDLTCREDAEINGFEECFSILEKQLCLFGIEY